MKNTKLVIGAGLLGLMMVFAAAAQELVSIDIGDAADAPGSTVTDGDTVTIEGSGSDIWNAADGFRYAYTEVSGDFEAIVHQISTELAKEWAKGGVHVRQSTDPGAQNVQAIVTGGGGGGSQITWRPAAGAGTEEFLGSAPGPWQDNECWIKLTRVGDEFHGYISEDGADWQDLQAAEAPMDDPVLVGLAVCGLDVVATATYDGFTVVSDGRTLYPLDVGSRGKIAVVWAAMKSR
jgi:hypothetical protein